MCLYKISAPQIFVNAIDFFSLCSSSPFSISFLHPPNVNEEAGTSKHLLKLSYDYSLSMSCVVFGLGE